MNGTTAMPTLAFEVSSAIAQEYRALPENLRQQLGLEIVFRLGKYTQGKGTRDEFNAALRKTQSESLKNGMTEAKMQSLVTELGHAA
jgi:hypothetical protein